MAILAAAAAGAVLAYAAHHVGPLRDHAVETVTVALFAAMLTAAIPAALAAAPSRLPTIVVAAPGVHAIRRAKRGDADFSAALHVEMLGHGFFTQLGRSFVRAYHRTFVDSPHAVAFVATVNDLPVGMLVGVLRPSANARWILRHRGIRLAVLGVVGLAVRPATGLRFLRTRSRRYLQGWRRNRRLQPDARPIAVEAAVLSHVAILPGARGTGIGRELVEAFLREARGDGAPAATLMTLDGPEGAGHFYAALGWRQGSVRTTPDGDRMVEWLVTFDRRHGA